MTCTKFDVNISTEPSQNNAPGAGTASSYATGGGGFVFEHMYGATLLVALLLGDSIPGLGDEQSVVSVAFQAGRISAVDDFVVVGESRGRSTASSRRLLSIGVRHKPRITQSDEAFVSLLADYLRTVEEDWEKLKSGVLRLALVVAGPNSGVSDLAKLAEAARSQPSAIEFRNLITTPRATKASVRNRLEYFDRAVEKAAREAEIETSADTGSDYTWRLLACLHPITTRLEGDEAADRAAAIARLRSLVGETHDAVAFFSELLRLASRYGPAGAVVDEAMLRRDLQGRVRLDRSPSYQDAWAFLAELDERVRNRTKGELTFESRTLKLERGAIGDQVQAAMRTAGSSGRPLVVTGSPDVGKSALVISAADVLKASGEVVLLLSLRDLPPSVTEITTRLRTSLDVLLGSLAVSPVRLLVVDGAEAAAEDRLDLLEELGRSARKVGIGLVAVTRSDAQVQVADALSSPVERLSQIEIPGLTAEDTAQVVTNFPALRRLSAEPRSAWLLQRPGLVSLLLRAEALAELPDGALSEADVFAAYWQGVVLRAERIDTGRGTPDGRESSLVALAHSQLLGPAIALPPLDPQALPSLRSDGLLVAPGPTAAWNPNDQFATDLIRDFALARLFITRGWAPLQEAGAPRWALRAARLACQAKIANAGSETEAALIELQRNLDTLASDYGDRWSDLPLEALITLGSPNDGLALAWPALADADGAGIKRLQRLVLQRYTDGLAADATVTEPVVQLLFEHSADLAQLPYEIGKSADEIEIRWLRGLTLRKEEDETNSLRVRFRDRLLSSGVDRHDERGLECLALLGPDLNAPAEACLRNLAIEAPNFLSAPVESVAAAASMACHHSDLLLALADAYYVVRRPKGNLDYSYYEDGIRRHHIAGGIGSRLASLWYGPFWNLLQRVPRKTRALVNRMLDHAVRVRIAQLHHLETGYEQQSRDSVREQDLPAVEIDLPEIGKLKFVGDSHAWSWYRGSSVGPYPCMSALLAIERFVDQAHRAGVDLRTLTNWLLQDCRNLAMPGLVVGFLVRHLDEVTNELDPWLEEPMVWSLEFGRSTGEGRLHVQGPDLEDIRGGSLRGLSLRDVATELTLRAIINDDGAAVSRLSSVADKLLARASVLNEPNRSAPWYEERMATIEIWASFLRADNYKAVKHPDGRSGFEFTPPRVTKEIAEKQDDLGRGMQIMRLLNYAGRVDRQVLDISELESDLYLARQLGQQPPEAGQEFTRDAFPAVAAAAIVAFAEDQFRPAEPDLMWALETSLDAARRTAESGSEDPSYYTMGGDRSAAISIPHLLLPAFNEDNPNLLGEDDLGLVEEALLRLMTSGSSEVRRHTARRLRSIWDAPCSLPGANHRCRHEVAFEAAIESVRDCQIGKYDSTQQRRAVTRIEGSLENALAKIDAEDVLLAHVLPSLVAVSTCAAAACCVSDRAKPLRDALLRVHARGIVYWVGEAFQLDANQEVGEEIAECLLGIAHSGGVEALQEYMVALVKEPLALSLVLREIACSATYDAGARATVREIWPSIMTNTLTKLEASRAEIRANSRRSYSDWNDAVAALLLRPQMRMSDTNFDETLERAREDWLQLAELEHLIERWLPLAQGASKSVDSMVVFVETMHESIQATQGLDLVLRVVDQQYDRVASNTWFLVDWLEKLRAKRPFQGETLAKVHLLVDGLVAHGDSRAVRLQKALE